MTKGLEALDRIAYTNGYDNDIATIEKELKALEIIIKKNVDIRLLKGCKYVDTYNDNIGYDEEVLTDEEFGLLMEVLGL